MGDRVVVSLAVVECSDGEVKVVIEQGADFLSRLTPDSALAKSVLFGLCETLVLPPAPKVIGAAIPKRRSRMVEPSPEPLPAALSEEEAWRTDRGLRAK